MLYPDNSNILIIVRARKPLVEIIVKILVDLIFLQEKKMDLLISCLEEDP